MEIQNYQKKCYKHYKESIDYPQERAFLYGNPVEVVVPNETAVGKVMVVGFHPGAKTFDVEGEKDVPLYSANFPYSSELYFDGKKARTVAGGDELPVVLNQLGISRDDCWVTSLVKVYLFSSKDVAKYNALGNFKVAPDEFNYKEYGEKSIQWLEQEISIASPELILFIGLETASMYFDVTPTKAKHLVDGELKEIKVGRKRYDVLCLQDVDLMINNNKRNPWPEVFERKVVPTAEQTLAKFDFIKRK